MTQPSDPAVIRFPQPAETLAFTGERYTPAMGGEIEIEHRHRYLFALPWCRGRRVLDIASGEGYGAALLATVATHVTGVDVDAASIAHAGRCYGHDHLTFLTGDATALPLADASVDVVVSFETIEHLEGHEAFLAEVRRVLAPDGLLVMSSPIRENYASHTGEANPFHVRELSKAEFTGLVGRHFAHMAVLEQKSTTASLILPEGGATGPGTLYRREAPGSYRRSGSLQRPVYALAVASNAGLPPIGWGGLDDDGLTAELVRLMVHHEQQAGTARQAAEAAHADLARTREAEERARAELMAERAETNRLGQELAARGEALEALAEARRRLMADVERLTEVRDHLATRQQRLSAERTGLARRVESLAGRLAATEAARDEAARRSAAEIARLTLEADQCRQALAAVKRSTSWRVTEPLRAMRLGLHPWEERARLGRDLLVLARNTARQQGLKGLVDRSVTALKRHGVRGLGAYRHPAERMTPLLRAIDNAYWVRASRPSGRVLEPRVLIIAELSIPQCAKYRVWQKQAGLETLGIPCTVLDWRQAEACRHALQTHQLAILYRVPGFPEPMALIREAERLGVPTLWEVDDLIFDAEGYMANRNLDGLDPALRRSVLDGVPLYRSAMLACSGGIASTPSLAGQMRAAGLADVMVIENALDTETLDLADDIRAAGIRTREAGAGVTIVYGSGTRTHDADFRQASEALLALLRQRPAARLRIIGHLTLPDAFDAVGDRVERLPASDYAGYMRLLGEADISIAPLEPNAFNDAKSNIKFLEAGILGLPSVCSPCASFRPVVRTGENGFLAQGTDAWLAALTTLVDDADRRRRMGQQARHDVLARYHPDAIAQRQIRPLADRLGRRPASPRLRVLMANIYFNPQSFGGATLVAEAMASALDARADTEVHIFSSWGNGHAPAYGMVRHEVAGMPVFSVRLPDGNDPVRAFDDPRMEAVFAEVLRAVRPDVVHLHAIQGLGVGLARACQAAGIPYVITLHDAWWLCGRQFMVKGDGRFCGQMRIDLNVCAACVDDAGLNALRHFTLRPVLEGAAMLLAPSRYFDALHRANGIPAERIMVNRNGVRRPDRPIRRQPAPQLRFGYVGGAAPVKGADLIRAAFQGLKRRDYTLILADNARNAGLVSLTPDQWRLPGRVEIRPAYTMDGIDDFFEGIDVLLFPSQCKESFGLTVREALLRDVWVVLTDAGGAVEDVVDGENGTILPLTDDPAPLRRAIQALLDDPGRLAGWRNPRQDSIADVTDQAAELHAVLDRVAGRTPQTGGGAETVRAVKAG